MIKYISSLKYLLLFISVFFVELSPLCAQLVTNPIIYADVPDISIIRVGKDYYMSSTTMHMSPGLPIMKSTDLINWKIVSYAYNVLGDEDALNLNNGKNDYGRGSWASSLRYHKGIFYVSTFSGTTGKTYIFTTKNIEKGPWKLNSFRPSLHDHSLFIEDNGKVYMVYGAGKIMLAEINNDLSGIKTGTIPKVIIEDASLPAGRDINLKAEGSQIFKINGKYYLFNITWPKNGMRTVIIHRSNNLEGPYEGRIGLQDLGVAQGGLISTPENTWFSYLFRDYGAVGRVPYLVPVKWIDDWPILGTENKITQTLNLPSSSGLSPGIVNSDEFSRGKNELTMPLVWQWNHNPDSLYYSVTDRAGFLRLTNSRIDTNLLQVKNILTQRTFGPKSSATTAIDVSNMKSGDYAGLMLLQKEYAWVGVRVENGTKSIVMVTGSGKNAIVASSVPLTKSTAYLKAVCNFEDQKDLVSFYYSLNGTSWIPIGAAHKLRYTIPHFMGYRFGLFNCATKEVGGFVDFDFFRIGSR